MGYIHIYIYVMVPSKIILYLLSDGCRLRVVGLESS